MTIIDYPDWQRFDQQSAATPIVNFSNHLVPNGGIDGPYYVGPYGGLTITGFTPPIPPQSVFLQFATDPSFAQVVATVEFDLHGTDQIDTAVHIVGPQMRIIYGAGYAGNHVTGQISGLRSFASAAWINGATNIFATNIVSITSGTTYTQEIHFIPAGPAQLTVIAPNTSWQAWMSNIGLGADPSFPVLWLDSVGGHSGGQVQAYIPAGTLQFNLKNNGATGNFQAQLIPLFN